MVSYSVGRTMLRARKVGKRAEKDESRSHIIDLPLVGRSKNPKDFSGGGKPSRTVPPTRNLLRKFRPPHKGEVRRGSVPRLRAHRLRGLLQHVEHAQRLDAVGHRP